MMSWWTKYSRSRLNGLKNREKLRKNRKIKMKKMERWRGEGEDIWFIREKERVKG